LGPLGIAHNTYDLVSTVRASLALALTDVPGCAEKHDLHNRQLLLVSRSFSPSSKAHDRIEWGVRKFRRKICLAGGTVLSKLRSFAVGLLESASVGFATGQMLRMNQWDLNNAGA
jgi:hypothetical protein